MVWPTQKRKTEDVSCFIRAYKFTFLYLYNYLLDLRRSTSPNKRSSVPAHIQLTNCPFAAQLKLIGESREPLIYERKTKKTTKSERACERRSRDRAGERKERV